MKLRRNVSDLSTVDDPTAPRVRVRQNRGECGPDDDDQRPSKPVPRSSVPPVDEERRDPAERSDGDVQAVRLELEGQVAGQGVAPHRDEQDDQDER